jgi:hypothetical protein
MHYPYRQIEAFVYVVDISAEQTTAEEWNKPGVCIATRAKNSLDSDTPMA